MDNDVLWYVKSGDSHKSICHSFLKRKIRTISSWEFHHCSPILFLSRMIFRQLYLEHKHCLRFLKLSKHAFHANHCGLIVSESRGGRESWNLAIIPRVAFLLGVTHYSHVPLSFRPVVDSRTDWVSLSSKERLWREARSEETIARGQTPFRSRCLFSLSPVIHLHTL